ncbi:hypothetical protein CHS0354_014073 [Potamilus streckersoni]|uniref:Uncharacterized protein n=1 Tax=Potamilus streckersoni TaxID=2493646 RepID=A0AAE0SLR6_9BIVA|nr:hypothetical protein CHS0354_014073 [Potamilus streckersoni]
MKKGAFIFIAGLLTNVQSVATGFETVWVRDVTAQFQTDKRALDDLDLPDQLTFDLRLGLDNINLNLKRNYDIDPNADIYVVQKLRNGRILLAKANELEKEAVAYYQDKDNGAYMTVRCVKRSNHKCDRIIKGNIRIGDYNYDLRPDESDVASGHTSKVPSLIGKRYVLLDEPNIEQENIGERYDTENVIETNLIEELNARPPRFTTQGKQNNFLPLDVFLSPYIRNLHDKRIKGENCYSVNNVLGRMEELLFPHNRSKVVIANGTKYIDAYHYTADLKEWVTIVGNAILPPFDHAMLFTT